MEWLWNWLGFESLPTADPVGFICLDCGPEPYFLVPLAEYHPVRAALIRDRHYEMVHDVPVVEVGPVHGGLGCIA